LCPGSVLEAVVAGAAVVVVDAVADGTGVEHVVPTAAGDGIAPAQPEHDVRAGSAERCVGEFGADDRLEVGLDVLAVAGPAVVGLAVLGCEAHALVGAGVADDVTSVAAVVGHRPNRVVDEPTRAGDDAVVAGPEVDEARVRRAVLDLVVAALRDHMDRLARGGADRLGRPRERAEVRVAADADRSVMEIWVALLARNVTLFCSELSAAM
jgi:hypothetical protein